MNRMVLCYDTHGVDLKQLNDSKGFFSPERFCVFSRDLVDSRSEHGLSVGQRFKQVLPYVVIKKGDKYLSYSRGKVGDSRMAGNYSIGFGGHVDIDDLDSVDGNNINWKLTALWAIERELEEELGLRKTLMDDDIGAIHVLYDGSNEVGTVHLGLVYAIEMTDKDAINATDECKELQWYSADELLARVADGLYEGWSAIIVNNLL